MTPGAEDFFAASSEIQGFLAALGMTSVLGSSWLGDAALKSIEYELEQLGWSIKL